MPKIDSDTLRQNEKTAHTTYSFAECARDWHEAGDTESAVRCLRIAESKIINTNDILKVSSTWLECGFPRNASLTLGFAPDCANNFFVTLLLRVRVFCALGDVAAWESHIESAEAKATLSHDWVLCANARADCGNDNAAMRCMDAAETRARNFVDWRICYENWVKVGNFERAKSCIKKLEGLSTNLDQLRACKDAWIVVSCNEEAQRIGDIIDEEEAVKIKFNNLYELTCKSLFPRNQHTGQRIECYFHGTIDETTDEELLRFPTNQFARSVFNEFTCNQFENRKFVVSVYQRYDDVFDVYYVHFFHTLSAAQEWVKIRIAKDYEPTITMIESALF